MDFRYKLVISLVELSGIEPLTSSLRNGFLMYFNNIAEQNKALLSGKQPVENLIVPLLFPRHGVNPKLAQICLGTVSVS
jgi:hypothetical protein